jgi:CBS domain-containing protein
MVSVGRRAWRIVWSTEGLVASTAAQIMGARGAQVATVAPDASLRTAATALTTRRIGALVVTDEVGMVVGILSERDIVRRLSEAGADCLELTVGEVMTGSVTTRHGDVTTDELMQLMTDGRFRHVPITDVGGVLVGIVSVGDVVKSTIGVLEVEKAALSEYVSGGY